jgi:hypothetical protein
LTQQAADGSWENESAMANFFGFAIPPDSHGVPRKVFLTEFAVAATQLPINKK